MSATSPRKRKKRDKTPRKPPTTCEYCAGFHILGRSCYGVPLEVRKEMQALLNNYKEVECE